jgi:A/G-specific adenine glycosylase
MKTRQLPARVRKSLLSWYRTHRRDLPWRRRPDLYHTLVAEFMLQQTRVEQALPYYERWMQSFPSMKALATAPLGRVMKHWEGLGYYHRAKNLHAAAKRLAGRKVVRLEDLSDCPGIGPYTRAAIGSIALGAPLAVVDGNVNRVVARLLMLKDSPKEKAGREVVTAWQARNLAPEVPGDWNQALMELGARVCLPRQPDCDACPLRSVCRARKRGVAAEYPVGVPKKPIPHRHIAAGIIRRADGRILIAQRPPKGLLPNLWEFPGGKRERRERLSECCRREIREELDIEVEVGRKRMRVRHAYSHFAITLHVFDCRYVKGRPKAHGCQAWKWVRVTALRRYPFPGANQPILDALVGET